MLALCWCDREIKYHPDKRQAVKKLQQILVWRKVCNLQVYILITITHNHKSVIQGIRSVKRVSGPVFPKGAQPPPQFPAHVCCGQTAGWIKMPLGSWYGGGPRPRPHCVRWGPCSPPKGAQQAAPLFAPWLLWPNGCKCQLLLSTYKILSLVKDIKQSSKPLSKCHIERCDAGHWLFTRKIRENWAWVLSLSLSLSFSLFPLTDLVVGGVFTFLLYVFRACVHSLGQITHECHKQVLSRIHWSGQHWNSRSSSRWE